ncbi:hypothetical protein SM0020_21116 [Sinorhizobium meliloti CCNWSX0020]|uniref:Uncharacterized protein n=1 Tax=Sinorhizobium meliloti CCNWSX0020 TaxID=1107881 RepID=H0G422_RHIML|nr:hypothetical protein SM0020_21116 [Sinorhizobium meliloti CCNWSX0020]
MTTRAVVTASGETVKELSVAYCMFPLIVAD